MKLTVTEDFFDLVAFVGRRAGDVIEVPEARAAQLIEMRFAEAEGARLAPKAKATAKATPKKAAKTN